MLTICFYFIREFYTQLKEDDLSISEKNIKTGLIVTAFLFNKWHRAEILSVVDKSNHLLVFFFDYGTKEKVNLKNVKYLLEIFSKLPRKALRGSLYGIKPKNGDTTWNVKSSIVLLEKIQDKRLFGKVVNYREKVNLLTTDNKEPN